MKGILHILLIAVLVFGITFHIRAQTGPSSATPSADRNHIVTYAPQVEGVQSTSQFFGKTVDELSATIQYFDGFGRLHQVINVQASPTKSNIIQPILYDAFGREVIKYLPYTDQDNHGTFRSAALGTPSNYSSSPQYQFYQAGSDIAHDLKPYAETIFESSPLNRILKQGAVGNAWQPNSDPLSMEDKTVKRKYATNVAEEVYLFTYDATTGFVDLNDNVNDRFYQPNQLYANKTLDEHNNEMVEYADKEGRIVCKKVQYGTQGSSPDIVNLYASTYYIYDDFGNLVAVLPPEAVKQMIALFPED